MSHFVKSKQTALYFRYTKDRYRQVFRCRFYFPSSFYFKVRNTEYFFTFLFFKIFLLPHTRNAQPRDILCGNRNSAVRRFLSLVDPVHQICLHKFTSKLYTRVEKYIFKVCICPEILSEDYRNTLFSFQYS